MSNPELPVARGVAVVIDDGRVLVIRRQRSGRAYAVLPGGHVQPAEARADTAVRELAEETTLQAQTARLLWTRDDGSRSASYYLMRNVVGTPIVAGGKPSGTPLTTATNSPGPRWRTSTRSTSSRSRFVLR